MSVSRLGLTVSVVAAAAAAMGTGTSVVAQNATPLPKIIVEGAAKKKAKSQAAKAYKPAPKAKAIATQPAPQPPEETVAAPAASGPAPDMPYKVPAAVSSVSSGELYTFGQVDTGDVLRTIPGVGTRESVNNPGIGINIRGLEGSGRVNTMIDGVRQNFRFTTHEAQGFAYVDPALIAGIDISRGAVSTAGGAGALAGSANLRTLDVDDIVKPGRNFGSLSRVQWGDNGIGWSEMTAAGARAGAFGIAGAVSKRDQDNYENAYGQEVPFTDQDLISGLAKARIRLAPDQLLTFGTVLYDNDFTANSYEQTITSRIFTAGYSYRPVDNPLIDFRLNLSSSEVEMQYLRGLNPFATNAGRVINDEGWGIDASNASRFNLGAVRVKSTYGYEYFFDDVDTINSAAVPNFGINPSGESSIAGAFSETTFSYGTFDLIGGLRYDEFTLEGSGVLPASNPIGLPGGPYTVDKSEGRFNPKATLAAKPLSWFQPYATYAESMRGPTINESLAGGDHPGGAVRVALFPNPFLDPEIQKGWEFGSNFLFDNVLTGGDKVRLKANYYRYDVDNYITACFSDRGQAFFCNTPGISELDGVEVEGMYESRMVFAGLTYSYNNSNLPAQQNGFGAQSYLPDHVLTLTGGVRLLDQHLTVGGRAYFTSEAFIGFINTAPGDSPYTDGYELLDLYANYEFDRGLKLGLNVTNVFDRAYTPALLSPATSSTGLSPDIELGRGLTVLLNAEMKF